MKILIVPLRYYPESGASPSRWAALAETLAKMGNEVDVLTSVPNYPYGKIFDGYNGRILSYEKRNGCGIYRYWSYPTVSRNVFKRIVNMFSSAFALRFFAIHVRHILSYDRVFIQTPPLPHAVSAMLLFKGIFRCKCVLNVSDIWPSTGVQMGAMKEGSFSYKYMSWCEKYLVRSADAIVGQSEEILCRVKELPNKGKFFLFRNIPMREPATEPKIRNVKLKICFAGMLGVPQNVLGILKNINFKEFGAEFHIIGNGSQYDDIVRFIESHDDSSVFIHDLVKKEKMAELYNQFDVALIPLTTNIKGAFPSKIYDALPSGMPLLYVGSGEPARFIEENELGFVSAPMDFDALKTNLRKMVDLSDEEYSTLSKNCIEVSREKLNYNKQINDLMLWL